MPDGTAGRRQGDLHALVPWLVLALADAKDAQPAAAGRLKAAAMQLLPPLLDGLQARRLAGASLECPVQKRLGDGQGAEGPRLQPFFGTLVGGPALAGTSALPRRHRAQVHSKTAGACCLHVLQPRWPTPRCARPMQPCICWSLCTVVLASIQVQG